jgi:RimJ/RimL family protein N-acetyltransferase
MDVIDIRTIRRGDLPILHAWRNDPLYRALCMRRTNLVSLDEFDAELKEDFENGRVEQVLISTTMGPIGTMFASNYRKDDAYVYVTTFFTESARYRGQGLAAFVLWTEKLSKEHDLRKIYLQVFGHNEKMLRLLRRYNIPCEGRLRAHHRVGDSWVDLYTFAFYPKTLAHAREVLQRLGVL